MCVDNVEGKPGEQQDGVMNSKARHHLKLGCEVHCRHSPLQLLFGTHTDLDTVIRKTR